MDTLDIIRKNPSDGFDVNIDWSPWLPDNATVGTCVWTLPAGLQKDDARTINSGKTSTLWLLGGTAGAYYTISALMTGAGNGVVKQQSLVIRVVE